ncbi:hypothetical protein ACEPAI_7068 [Sanghuangporus weigelae]
MPKHLPIQVLSAEEMRFVARKNISDTAKDTPKPDSEQFQMSDRAEPQRSEEHSTKNGEREKLPENGGSSMSKYPSIYALFVKEMMRTKEFQEDPNRSVARKDMPNTAKDRPKAKPKQFQVYDRAEPQQPEEHSIKNGEREKPPENGGVA